MSNQPQAHQVESDWSLLLFFWVSAKKYHKKFYIAFLFLPMVSATVIIPPIQLKRIIDQNITAMSSVDLFFNLLLLVGIMLLSFVVRAIQSYLMGSAGICTMTDLRAQVMSHYLNQPLHYFETRANGVLVSRVTNDIDVIGDNFINGVVLLFADVLTFLGIICAMVYLDWRLATAVIITVPVLALLIKFCSSQLRKYYDRVREDTGIINAILNETIQGIREVQLFNYQPYLEKKFGQTNDRFKASNIKIVSYDSFLYSCVEGVSYLALSLLVATILGLDVFQTLSIGVLVAFIDYLNKFFMPVREFSQRIAFLQAAFAAIAKIKEVLHKSEALPEGAHVANSLQPRLIFKNVSFAYPARKGSAETPWVVQNINMDIKPGQKVAIVGTTGSGKSTLIKLITRQYFNQNGEILIDGVKMQEWSSKVLRDRIACVQQDLHLFADTIDYNIRLGRNHISREYMINAAQMIGAHEFIQKLPLQYDTILKDNGGDLSYGQRQLIVFARAVASQPDLLILDEATAHIDSESEALIQQATEKLLTGKTSIIIAHRLSTILACDQILLMEKGQIIERGSHEQLLSMQGKYAELFQQKQISPT